MKGKDHDIKAAAVCPVKETSCLGLLTGQLPATHKGQSCRIEPLSRIAAEIPCLEDAEVGDDMTVAYTWPQLLSHFETIAQGVHARGIQFILVLDLDLQDLDSTGELLLKPMVFRSAAVYYSTPASVV